MASRVRVSGHYHLRQPHRPNHHHQHHHHSSNRKSHHQSHRYEQAFLLLSLLIPAAFLDISEATYSYDPGPEFEPAPGGLNVTTFTGQTSRLPCSVKHLNGKTVSWIRGRDLQVLSSDRHTFATDIRISVLPGPSQKSAFDRQWKPIKTSTKGKKKTSFKGARLRRSLVKGHSRVGHPAQGEYDGGTVRTVGRKGTSDVEDSTGYVNTSRHRPGGVSGPTGDTILRWERPYQLQEAKTVSVARRVKRLPVNPPELFEDPYSELPGIHHYSHLRDPHYFYHPQRRYEHHYHYPHQHQHHHQHQHQHQHQDQHQHQHQHRQQHQHKVHTVQDTLFAETQSSGYKANYPDHLQTLQVFSHHHQKPRNQHSHLDGVAPLPMTLVEEPVRGGELPPLPLSHLLDSEEKPQPPLTISHLDPHLQTSSSSLHTSLAENITSPPSRPIEKVNSHSKRSSFRTFSSKHSSFSSSSLHSSSSSPYSGSSYSNSNDLTLDWRADDFTLQIKYTEPGDAGTYICQVNTEPSMVQVVTLNVIDMEAEIVGKRELYVKAGTPVVLKCRVRHGDLMPGFIFWYKGKRLVDYTSTGGRIQVLTSPEGQSQLILESALPSDSGNYTCYPPGGTTASVQLGVIVDERPAAMQQGNGGSTTFTTATTATTTASSAIVFPSLPTTVTSVTLFVSRLLSMCDLLDFQLGEVLLCLALSIGAMMALPALLNSGASLLFFLGVAAATVEFLRQGTPWKEELGVGSGRSVMMSLSSSSPTTSPSPSHSHLCLFSFPFHFFFRILLPILLFIVLLLLQQSPSFLLPLSFPVPFHLSFSLCLLFFYLLFFYSSTSSSSSSSSPSSSCTSSFYSSTSLPSPSFSSSRSASPTGPLLRARPLRSSVGGVDEEISEGLTQVRHPVSDRPISKFKAPRYGRYDLKSDKQGDRSMARDEEGEELLQRRGSRLGEVFCKRSKEYDVMTTERRRQRHSCSRNEPRTR